MEPNLTRKLVATGGCLVLFASGTGVGHILTKLRMQKQFEEDRRKENIALEEYYAKLYKRGQYSSPAGVLDENGGQEEHDKALLDNATEAMEAYRGETGPDSLPKRTRQNVAAEEPEGSADRSGTRVRDDKGRFAPKDEARPNGRLVQPNKENLEDIVAHLRGTGGIKEPGPVPYNTFTNPQPASTDEELEEQRGKGDEEEIDTPYAPPEEEIDRTRPYLITEDEFLENEPGYTQIPLTLYSEDSVLADDSDMPLDDEEIDKKIGKGNLGAFGYIENQPEVVLIRNEVIEIDYEIARSEGSFGREVGGFVEETSPPKG